MVDLIVSGKKVKIRQLKKDDVNLVYDFFEKLSPETEYFFHPHDFDYKTAKKITEQDVDNPQIIRYAALIKDSKEKDMIAYVFFLDWNREIPWLGIGVCDDWQGKGLGKSLLRFMICQAQKHSKKGIQLTTMKDNERAQRLYKKLGFKIIGEKHGEHWLKLLF